MEPAAKKPRVAQKFREDWSKSWPFIAKSSLGDSYARCSICPIKAEGQGGSDDWGEDQDISGGCKADGTGSHGNTAQTHFFEDVSSFFSTALGYVISKLPVQDQLLAHAEVLNVKLRSKQKFASVRYLASRFNCLEGDLEVEAAELQFSKYM
ncbi:hypothetical protein RRG08_056746 [Elysia crispata]|uniref:Uncharacterized protein n=1 Tax=Elysia crispata TaxID=231223 RepID=A0AAE0ZR27_9GAST|nr:hypothetical protein RRG08_056746 [Elysia crispata]